MSISKESLQIRRNKIQIQKLSEQVDALQQILREVVLSASLPKSSIERIVEILNKKI